MRAQSPLRDGPTRWRRIIRLNCNGRLTFCWMPGLFATVSRPSRRLSCLHRRRMGSCGCALTIVSSMRERFGIVSQRQRPAILSHGREGQNFSLRSICTVVFINCVCVRRISTRRHLSLLAGIMNGYVHRSDSRPRRPRFSGSCLSFCAITSRRVIVWCIAMTLQFSVFRMIRASIWPDWRLSYSRCGSTSCWPRAPNVSFFVGRWSFWGFWSRVRACDQLRLKLRPSLDCRRQRRSPTYDHFWA